MKNFKYYLLTGVGAAAIALTLASFGFNNKALAEEEEFIPKLETNVSSDAPVATPAPKKPNIAMPGWSAFIIQADTTEVMMDLFNPEANKDYYYLTFELCVKPQIDPEHPELADQREFESIYRSGLVEPGMHLTRVTLDHPLEAGEYEAIVKIQPYEMGEKIKKTNNNGAVPVKLYVQ